MMKKLLFVAFCGLIVLTGCNGNSSQNVASDTQTTDSTEMTVPQDTTPKPMFLYILNKDYMQMVYWTSVTEPVKSDENADYFDQEHALWELQEGFRRNAAQYTKLVTEKGAVLDLKYIGEILKNPDGEEMYSGELHGRSTIPSPGLKYAFVNSKDARKIGYMGSINVVVTESYLQSRTFIPMTACRGQKKLPSKIVKQLEEQYKMKSGASILVYTHDRYSYGILQFKGAYRTVEEYGEKHKVALALEVFTVGDTVYSFPVEGYYDDTYGPTWNADDGGEYYPSSILAFEGPKGPEFCYVHGAPESITVGMFYIEDGHLQRQQYEVYHSMYDEDEPLWKKDIARMQELCRKADPKGYKGVTFTKYRYLYIDGDDTQEIWLRDKDDQHGAFFLKNGNGFELIGMEKDCQFVPLVRKENYNSETGYLELMRQGDGTTFYEDIYEIKHSRVIHHFQATRNEKEGIVSCTLDKKPIDTEQGQQYMSSLPEADNTGMYWNDLSNR